MTECERIIKNGILSKDYFIEEVRNDFLVESFRKKLWAVELDMLLEIDRICKKYDIKYFLFFGSLLGAIRHHGFIPWDDDLDIIMSRDDYEEFVKHGDEFKDPYFFQNSYTDPEFLFVHSRIRNNNTAAIQRPFATQKFNHGCFIDVIYYDNITKDDNGQIMFNELTNAIVDCSTWMKLSNPYPNERDSARIKGYNGLLPLDALKKVQTISQRYRDVNTQFVASTAAVVYGYEKLVYNIEDFSKAIYVEFEGYKFPIPCGWNRILKICYGDYMQMPPLEKRGGWHGEMWYDPDKSYIEIVKSNEFNDWLKKKY